MNARIGKEKREETRGEKTKDEYSERDGGICLHKHQRNRKKRTGRYDGRNERQIFTSQKQENRRKGREGMDGKRKRGCLSRSPLCGYKWIKCTHRETHVESNRRETRIGIQEKRCVLQFNREQGSDLFPS